jgi:hypothetical protein
MPRDYTFAGMRAAALTMRDPMPPRARARPLAHVDDSLCSLEIQPPGLTLNRRTELFMHLDFGDFEAVLGVNAPCGF